MENMLITTTPVLDGYRIKKYIGTVVMPILGAGNIVKDWFAGNPSCYQRILAKFINNHIPEMTAQAKEQGANAIIGLHMETMNIFAGKSIISIIIFYGTAVIAEMNTEAENE
jgi:uncharacterized protein YbjQ (UPF0145 family)